MSHPSFDATSPITSLRSLTLKHNLLLLLSPKSRERINRQERGRMFSSETKAAQVKLPFLRKAEQTRGNILRWKFAHISPSPARRGTNSIMITHMRSNSEKYPFVLPKIAPEGADYLLKTRLLQEALRKGRRLRASARLSKDVTYLSR